MHLVLKRGFEQMLRLCFRYDKQMGKDRTVAGVLRNQQFQRERSVADIDLAARIRVEYGMGLGRDPAQSMVIAIQSMQAGLVSSEFVQENFEGITNVALEQQRLDAQMLKELAMAQLMQGLESGSIPKKALIEIYRARMNGENLFDLFDKYIVKPEQEALDAQVNTGLPGGEAMMPGAAPPGAGGLQPPPPPDIEAMLSGLAGGGGPPGAEPPTTISRLSVPLGQGSFAGTQVQR
jgi:hypothetical protein